jgi:hypothetical protein
MICGKGGGTKMPKKKKHVSPAKIKYDKTHPVVAIRVDLELKEQLEEAKKAGGKSVRDLLREALKVQTPKFKINWNNGYQAARYKYCVTYSCSKCGKPIEITSENEKKAAAQCMTKNGWGHVSCPK